LRPVQALQCLIRVKTWSNINGRNFIVTDVLGMLLMVDHIYYKRSS